MALHNIMMVMVIATLCLWNCNESSKADKPRKDEARLQCEAFCKECLSNSVPLKRMGCLEKCIAKGVESFACPGTQTFLGEVAPMSPVLVEEVQQFWEERAGLFTAKNIEAIGLTFTSDCVLITDKQMPVIGRDDRKKKLSTFFDVNPDLGRIDFNLAACGEEDGVIWFNGRQDNYNTDGKELSAYGFMSLVTHVDGKLQEYMVVLFPDEKPEDKVDKP